MQKTRWTLGNKTKALLTAPITKPFLTIAKRWKDAGCPKISEKLETKYRLRLLKAGDEKAIEPTTAMAMVGSGPYHIMDVEVPVEQAITVQGHMASNIATKNSNIKNKVESTNSTTRTVLGAIMIPESDQPTGITAGSGLVGSVGGSLVGVELFEYMIKIGLDTLPRLLDGGGFVIVGGAVGFISAAVVAAKLLKRRYRKNLQNNTDEIKRMAENKNTLPEIRGMLVETIE